MKDKVLIVPTIREDSFKRFIEEWQKNGLLRDCEFILMEDNPKHSFPASPDLFHACWESIEQKLGNKSWIIPRRSDTVRSFAYWLSYQFNFSRMLTLDDDCYPDGVRSLGLFSAHEDALNSRTRWFNTLDNVKPRGIPFKNVGTRDVYLNHGLWTKVLDYDAPTQLVCPMEEEFSYDNQIVPRGQYFPMCGMNVCWRKEITVLMYHLLMGCVDVENMPEEHADNVYRNCLAVEVPGYDRFLYRLPFDRFGDIWCGILMKKVCDHLDYAVSSGTPYIQHDRASDPFKNLRKEANGLEVNEFFWERIDRMKLTAKDPVGCYRELAIQMGYEFGDNEHAWYFRMLGDAMVIWADLFTSTL